MPTSENLGNVVGLIKSETPPTKTYVIWAHVTNPLLPNVVVLKYYDGSSWVPLGSGAALPSQVTLDLVFSAITSRVVNGENVTLKWIDTATGEIMDFSAVVTGTRWTCTIGDQQFVWINGEIVETEEGELFFHRYSSTLFDDGDFIITSEKFAGDKGNTRIFIEGNETGDTKMVTTEDGDDGTTIVQDTWAGGTQTNSKEFKTNLTALDNDEPDNVIVFKDLTNDFEIHPWQKANDVILGATELGNISTGTDLLPNLVGILDKYYSEYKLVFEYTPGSTPYAFTDDFAVYSKILDIYISGLMGGVVGSLIHGTTRKRATLYLSAETFVTAGPTISNFVEPTIIHNGTSSPGIRLKSLNGGDASAGDGQLKVEVYYRKKKYVDPFI